MQYIAYSLAVWAALLFCGLPLAVGLLPNQLRWLSVPAAALFGYCYIVFVSYWLYRLDVGGSDRYAYWLLAPPFLALLFLFALRRLDFSALLGRDALIMLALTAFGFVVMSSLFILSDGRAVSMAISNHDVVELAEIGRFLQEFHRSTTVGFMGQSHEMVLNADDIWFGPSSIAAVMSSLFHSSPFRLQTLVLVVLAAQGSAFVYALAQDTLSFNRPTAVAVGVLHALSPIVAYTVWQSFGGQAIGLSLMLCSIYLMARAQNEPADLKVQLRYLPPLVLLWSGLLVTYHFLILIIIALSGSYILVVAIAERSWRRIVSTLLVSIFALASIVLLDPYRVPSFVKTFLMLAEGTNGWFIPWLSPDLQLGFDTARAFTGSGIRTWPLGALLVGALVVAGGWTVFRQRSRTPLVAFAIGLFLPAILIGFYYAFSEQQNGMLGSYRSFKITSLFVAFTLIMSATWFGYRSIPRDRVATTVGGVLLAGLVVVGVMQVNYIFRFARAHMYVPSEQLTKIGAIEKMNFVKGLNILDDTNFDLFWAEYFTMRKRQVYQRFVYTGRNVGPLTEAYNLQKNKSDAEDKSDDIFSVALPKCEKRWPINDRLSLCKRATDFDVTIEPGKGWWGQEPAHRWSGRDGRTASVVINLRSPSVRAVLRASHGPLRPGDAITLSVNGHAVPVEATATGLVSEPFVLEHGRNNAQLTEKLDPASPTPHDGRTLGVLWQRISIEMADGSH